VQAARISLAGEITMRLTLWSLLAASLICAPAWAADNKDNKDSKDNKSQTKPSDKGDSRTSPAVEKTRKKLEDTKIDHKDCDFKDEPLESVLKKLVTENAEVSFYFDNSVARHKAITFTLKDDKPLKDVLDEMFKRYDIGYVIHRKDKEADRYDGWLLIKGGNERGDEMSKDAKKDAKPAKPSSGDKPAAGDKPAKSGDSKPADTISDEDRAASKLKNAKKFLEMNLKADAREYCEEIIKKYPKTKAAEEAKEMLEKLK
jgi:hypothetical protein